MACDMGTINICTSAQHYVFNNIALFNYCCTHKGTDMSYIIILHMNNARNYQKNEET